MDTKTPLITVIAMGTRLSAPGPQASVVALLQPGGHRALVAEMVALRIQLIAVSRNHKKSPPLSPIQRLLLGLSAELTSFRRFKRVAIIVKPSTILKFHGFLVKRKYRQLYSNEGKSRATTDTQEHRRPRH